MPDIEESTSHPAVRAAIDKQSKIFFSEVAKDHVTPLWRTVMASLTFLLVAVAANSLINHLPKYEVPISPTKVVAPPGRWPQNSSKTASMRGLCWTNPPLCIRLHTKNLQDSVSLGLFFIAATYLVGGLNNRRNRTRFFAAALWEMIIREGGRDRFQVEKVVQGGKIGSILDNMKAGKNSQIDIQWTFFYREEHSSRLFADCIRNNQNVRVLLCLPKSPSLLTRVGDMKGSYESIDDIEETRWRAAHAELSLGNLTFAREFLITARMNPKLLDHCDVRFADLYIGRPEVIITPNSAVRPFPRGIFLAILRLARDALIILTYAINFIWKAIFPPINSRRRTPAIFNFLLSNNFNSELKETKVGMGIYLTQESSKYPFFIFRPEPDGDASNLVPGDAVTQFNLRWDHAKKLADGPGAPLEARQLHRNSPFWLLIQYRNLFNSARRQQIHKEKRESSKRRKGDKSDHIVWPPKPSEYRLRQRKEALHDDTEAWLNAAEAYINKLEDEIIAWKIKVLGPDQPQQARHEGSGSSAQSDEPSDKSRPEQPDPFAMGSRVAERWYTDVEFVVQNCLELAKDEASEQKAASAALEEEEFLGAKAALTGKEKRSDSAHTIDSGVAHHGDVVSLENQFVRVGFFITTLFLSLIISYIAPPLRDSHHLYYLLIRLSALILQSISLAILFSIVDPRDLKTQFDACVHDLREIVEEQEKFGIVKIVEGGKFYDIVKQMNLEYGDKILIHWSFLQHEQASEDFKAQVSEQNLDVALLLMEPFELGLDRRAQDLAMDHPQINRGMFAAKSLGNLDFVRRQGPSPGAPSSRRDAPSGYRVRYSSLEMGRPMIIVCKGPDNTDLSKGTAPTYTLNDLVVKQVALGHFLTGESSKYPFIVFGAGKGTASKNLCKDALDFFINRWRDAVPLERVVAKPANGQPMDIANISMPHEVGPPRETMDLPDAGVNSAAG